MHSPTCSDIVPILYMTIWGLNLKLKASSFNVNQMLQCVINYYLFYHIFFPKSQVHTNNVCVL